MLLIFVGAILCLLCVAVVATLLAKQLPETMRVRFSTVIYTLLFTPSWAPATIVVVPIPFGVMLGVGALTGALNEILDLLLLFWWWHLPAFIVTGFISYKVASKVFGVSNVQSSHT
ncbi:hypothetical protein [Shewanella woodyi]|uniref:hypothetical protein n=1 Tax=Shewanella woodyi TaxID=60961 RepID=UPI0007EB3D12|nr:hypothetical protein [Shewanella woodyi]